MVVLVLLRRNVFDMLIAKTYRTSWLAPELVGVNGAPLDICGKTEIRVNDVPIPIIVYVAKRLPHDMMLGDPSLWKGRGNKAYIKMNFHDFLGCGHCENTNNQDSAALARSRQLQGM